MGKKRNGEIDLLKFLCCWIIAFFHFYGQTSEHFISGRYCVEFYFLVAGIFFFMSAEKMLANPKCTPYDYLKKRFWRFFPPTFCAFIFTFLVKRVMCGNSITARKFLDYLSDDIWEILLIKMNGMNSDKRLLNGPAWTIGAMLIAEFFIFACLWCFKDKFTNFILPVSLVVGYGFWRHVESADQSLWTTFTTFGVIRAYLTIGLSYYCLKLSNKLKKIPLNRRGKELVTFFNVLFYICVMWIITNTASRNYQWTSTIMFVMIIAIAMSGHSLINDIASRFKLSSFLGEFSMNIYLVHYAVYSGFRYLYTDPYVMYSHKFEFMGVTIVAAFAHYFIVKYSLVAMKKIKIALKEKIIIKDETYV